MLRRLACSVRRGLFASPKVSAARAAAFSSSPTDVASPTTDAADSKSGSKLLHSFKDMTDDEIVQMIRTGTVSQYKLERELKRAVLAGLEPDCKRAVRVRREWLNGENDNISENLHLAEDESSRGLPYGDRSVFPDFY